jgi:hypothetical protein
MPKMFSKQSAVHALLTLGERLAEEAAEKNLPEMVVGAGELRRLLNAGNRRGKSTLSLALRRFAASKNFTTQRWSLEVVDIRKPIIVIKRRS